MELFEEIYGSYFQAVRKILTDAKKKPLTPKEMEADIQNISSLESTLVILPKLLQGAWHPLLVPEGEKLFSCALGTAGNETDRNFLKPPLTRLQKSWLKALLADPRFRLFFPKESLDLLEEAFRDIEALYHMEDFYYFDQYEDGDPYGDPVYRSIFQTVLEAMTARRPLLTAYRNRKGAERTLEVLPCRFQYSPKDDKFRLLCVSLSKGCVRDFHVLNLSRIEACHVSKTPVPKSFDWDISRFQKQEREPVRIRIYDQRNALERCMLHFASYEKQTVYEPAANTWLCSIYYDPADETELLIALLSFGPVIQILGPEAFLAQVRRRVKRQHELFYGLIE